MNDLINQLLNNSYSLEEHALSGNEDFGYFKTIKDSKGNKLYMIEFAFYSRINSVSINIIPVSIDNRADMTFIYRNMSIGLVESIAAEYYNSVIKKFFK